MMMSKDDIFPIGKAIEDDIIMAVEDNFLSYISAIPSKNDNIVLDKDELLLIRTGVIRCLTLPCNEEKVRSIFNLIKTHLEMPLLWCVGPRATPNT